MTEQTKTAVLDYIRSHLRDLSQLAHNNRLETMVYMIEVAVMEAEYELTGVFPKSRSIDECIAKLS